MRELQSILNNYISNVEKQKRHLAILVTLSLLVSFIVPYVLVEPADSLTKDSYNLSYFGADILSSEGNMVSNLNGGQTANNDYSPGQLSEVALLIGEHNDASNPITDRIDWADGCTNAERVIDAAKREFFIGIASEFCLFLEEDFTPTAADTEGRVAAGGNVQYFSNENNGGNYQIAAGDFQTGTIEKPSSLNRLEDQNLGLKNYAHLIMGGNILRDVSTLGTTNKGSRLAPEEDDRYKRFVVPESFVISDNLHQDKDWQSSSIAYGGEPHEHKLGEDYLTVQDEDAQFYMKTDLIDFSDMYDWMRSQSEKLASKTPTGTTSDFVSASVDQSKKKVIFTGPGTNAEDPTVYFTLPSWPSDLVEIEFVGIPEFTNEDGSTTYANMVVNCMDTGIVEIPQNQNRVIINGKRISKETDNEENNQKESELILYNFPLVGTDLSNDPLSANGELPTKSFTAGGTTWSEEYNFYINKNFNGTIFAPNAIVVSEAACGGHLSGALIANSFTGGLEFGYRPYRGGTDILGSTAGYVVPFDKLAPNGEHLEDASFVIKDENDKIVESWKSGEETAYITLPSGVDFEGGTVYTGENNTIETIYTIEEQKAPEGYIKTDKTYKIRIIETVDLDSLITSDGSTVPTKVLAQFELYEDNGATPVDSREMTIEDTYSDNGIIQRIISIEDENGKQYFVLDINESDGKINSVGVPVDPSILEEDNIQQSFDDLTVDYQKPEVLEGEETGDGAEGEGTGEGTEGEGTGDNTEGEGETSLFPEDYEAPTLTATYGQTLADVDFPEVSYGSWTWKTPSDTVGNVGTNTFTAIFTPTDEEYTAQEVQLQVTVSQAIPSYESPTGLTATYGQTLANVELPNGWTWKDSTLSVGNIGTNQFTAIFTPSDTANYQTVEETVNVTVGKGTPEYTIPTGLSASYGQTLADVVLPDGWSWKDVATTSVGNAGTRQFTAIFTPSNTDNYQTVEVTLNVTVSKIDPECTFPTGLTAIYGQTLAEVKGLPTVDNGRFEWESSGDTIYNVGTIYKKLKFIPNDENYNILTQLVAIEVSKADPNPTVPTGLTVTYGSKLSSVTLPSGWAWDADADISGNAGGTVTYSATFTPAETSNYITVTKDITLTIVKAKPTVEASISASSHQDGKYRQKDSIPEINIANASVEGTIKWIDGSPSQLKYGKNVLKWEFIPTDTTNYETVTGSVTIEAEPIATKAIEQITDTSAAKVFTLNESENAPKYYYDPESIMVMPLPDTTPSFVNEYGLVFKKLDDGGNLLSGASISLQSGTVENGEFKKDELVYNSDSELKWDWEDGTSSSATIPVKEITVSELTTGTVYRFFENEAPSEDYEIADPIYFMKKDASTIIYTKNKDDLTNTAAWTELNLNEGEYTIEMTDRGVYGAGITLVKTNSNGTVRLDGAEFELYAVGAKEPVLVYPLNDGEYFEFVNGEVNLYDWFNSVDPNTYNSDYVQNGYLKPGGYYLYEVKPPSQAYERPDGPLYFTVEERTDADGKTYYEVTSEKAEAPDETVYEFSVDSSNNLQNWAYGNAEGVSKIEVYVTGASEVVLYENGFSGQTASVVDGVATFEGNIPSTITTGFKIQNTSYNNGLTVTKVMVYAPEIIPDDYSFASNAITLSPVDPYTSFNVYDQVAGYQIWADGTVSDAKKVEIILDKPQNGTIIIYENSVLGNKTFTVVDGVATINFDSATNLTKFKIQNNSYTDGLNVKEVRVYSQSALDNPTTDKPDLFIKTLTVHYLDGEASTLSNIIASDSATDNKYPFDITSLVNKNNIVGMTVELDGTGTGNINIGDAWTISGAKAGTYTVGVTDYKPETSVEDGDTSHLVNASGTTLTIKNEAQGVEADITVIKKWAKDPDFTQYRPSEIEVKLYRGTKADGSDKVYIGDIKNDESLANFNGTVKLNESNNWQYTWTDLPSAYAYEKNEDGTDNPDKPIRYYYFAEETTKLDKYTVSYPTQGSTSGDYTITNTLDTINLPVKKVWETYDNTGITIPTEIEVKLQMKVNGEWTDTGKTLTLNADNSWSGTFEDLPEGETYRAFEENVPNGWINTADEVGTSEDGKQLTVTNALDVGRLTLKKLWSGDAAGNRPGSIKLNIYRTTTRPGSGSTGGGTTGGDSDVEVEEPESTKYATVTEDYARLLQYSLYFYDANMCGDEVTETSVLKWRDDCHTDDGDYSGGYHDAGDHAMFGLTQGFSASTLGWTYNEYSNTFKTLGLDEHYQVVMDYFCDFFVNSTVLNSDGSVSKLILDKGIAGTDHNYWGRPETQSIAQRGGIVWSNSSDQGGNIAAQYAASLAAHYLNTTNSDKKETYLKYAKALYEYSKNNSNAHSVSGIYADNESDSEIAWAAAWLYLATGEANYKTECENRLKPLSVANSGYYWGNPTLGTATLYSTRIDNSNSDIKKKVTEFLSSKISDPSSKSYVVIDGWASARHNTLTQLVALTYDKYQTSPTYQTWSKNQMAYILGDNSISSNGNAKTCFVVGFAPNSSKYPHHRAASGYTVDETKENSKYDTDGHVLVGALVGGPNASGGYLDQMDGQQLVWQTNEVTVDYNAGLVGAAAALYSVYGTGHTVTEDVMVKDGLELKTGKHIYEYTEEAAAVDYSAMNLSFDTVSVRAKEVCYPPITNIGTLTSSYQAFSLSYENVTRIEVDYVYNNDDNNDGWANITFNDWNIKDKTSIDGDTYQFVPTNKPATIYNFCMQGMGNADSITIKEIRLYYESNGPSIELTPESKTAKIGETFQITATGTTNKIDWTSSDTDVAEVDKNGNVTIKAMPESGNTVRITATDSVDSSATAYIDVIIEALTFSINSSPIVVGDSTTYNTNYSNAAISCPEGCTITGNTITAQKAGDYTFEATIANVSATASLKVSALAITGESTVDTGAKPTFGVNGQTNGHTFTWVSSDPTVLSIDNSGNAQAHKSGTVKLTVTKDGKYTSDEFSVTVQKGALSISVNPTQIRVGQTATLSAVNNEGQTVVYSSSDKNIATISGNNTVTAIGEGDVTITGTLGNENPTCRLEIIANPTIYEPNDIILIGTNDTLQLYADNIIDTAVWSSLDETVLTVSDTGLVTPVKAGKAKIRVTDTDGTYADYEITVQLEKATVTLPSDAKLVDQVTLLPDKNWQEEIENLPKYDENGNPYYYYIVELDSNGSVADTITGSGAIYVPTKYENNGTVLGADTEISVENTLTEKVEGQMPSTGGEGSEAYYIYGIILMLCSIAGYSVMKLRRGRRS